jgi:hypothetical protein
MKKLLLLTIVLLMTASAFAQEQETNVRVPSGYQGFLEYGNTFVFNENTDNTINLSTTHGFYMNGHMYVGIGLSLDINNKRTLIPIYANLRYVFFNDRTTSPVLGLRLGSFVSSNVKPYGDIAVGVRFASKRDFAINLMVTGTYYDNIYAGYGRDYYDENGVLQYEYHEIKYNNSGIAFRLGIEW